MSGFIWYPGKRQELSRDIGVSLEQTAEAVKTDVVMAQTVPYAEDSEENRSRGIVPGALQGSIYTDTSRSPMGEVSVAANTPYARRLYYHPEYNYFKGVNPGAGGLWWRPYLPGGNKEGFAAEAFGKLFKKARG
jgi:hypothetical protein